MRDLSFFPKFSFGTISFNPEKAIRKIPKVKKWKIQKMVAMATVDDST
jgi:hypothetical protein